jgi:stress-induced-phosphoprotein 1
MILQDPVIRNVLQDMQENPKSAQSALRDPVISAKLNKLIAAGILQVR